MTVYAVDRLIEETRRLAVEFRQATGRVLPVTQELAKHDAVRLLDLAAAPDDAVGVDAFGVGEEAGVRYQIKGRAVFDRTRWNARIGQLNPDADWDRVLLVLMDEHFEPFEIHEVEREHLLQARDETASGRRKQRGALSIARFKHIGRPRWERAAPESGR